MLEPLLSQLNGMRIILASSSKQRASLLASTVRDGASDNCFHYFPNMIGDQQSSNIQKLNLYSRN